MPLDTEVMEFISRPGGRRQDVGQSALDPEIFDYTRRLTAGERMLSKKERRDQAALQMARGKLEKSLLPGFYAYGVQAGAPIVSNIARLLGKDKYADTMNRAAVAVEQAQREREAGGPIPDILQSGLRGAGASLTTMIPVGVAAGPALGPYAAISAATSQEMNRAITEGKDAGKTGNDLAAYVVEQGVMEGLPAGAMQVTGLGGMESLVGRRAVYTGFKDALKRFGIQFTAEQIEEQITEHGHNIIAALNDVEPDALTPENIRRTTAETAVQTTIAMGFAQAITAGQSSADHAEIETHIAEKRIPSRRTWQRWKFPLKLGKTKQQRELFTEELGNAIEREQAEASIEQPTGAPVTPEEAEGVLGPEVVPEAPGEPVVAPIAAVEPTIAQEEPIEAQVVEEPPSPEVQADQETVALNNEKEAEIRQIVGLEKVPKEKLAPAKELLANVIATNAADTALTTARTVLKMKKPRALTRYEHVTLVVRTRELLADQEAVWENQASAAKAGNSEKFTEALAQEEEISKQIEDIVNASQYSGTEISGMFSIRQMVLSRDPSDYASVLKRVRAAVGPKGTVSKAQKEEITKLSKENAKLQKLITAHEDKARAARDKQDEEDAQKVMDVNKPKKGLNKKYGKQLKEKAAVEIEDIKKQIRQMGLRVNEASGIAPEALWMIGRLSIAYIKRGVGSLVEVSEQIQADMPDAQLSKFDVYRAIIMRNPNIISKVQSEAEKKVSQFKIMARIHLEMESMARGIDPEIIQRVPVNAEIKALKKKLRQARDVYYASDIAAEKLERAIDKVNRLQDQLKNGRDKIKREPTEIPPELAGVHEQIRNLTTKIRVKEELERTNEQLRTGIIDIPVKRVRKVIDKEYELDLIRLKKNKRMIKQLIRNAAPLTKWEKVAILGQEARTLMATGELSYTFRQNAVQMGAHPLKTLGIPGKIKRVGKAIRGEPITTPAEAFFPSLRAAFSQQSADEINFHLENSPNGPIYETSKLSILDNESPDDALRSEVFKGRYIERVPGLGSIIRASARHGVTFSNMNRTVNMDHFIHMYPNATRAELNAWADWQNTSSGLGSLWHFAKASWALGQIFFSPKFSASRVQTPFKVFQYWKLPRVRNAIAKDMLRFTATGMSVLATASLALGPGVVEWWDPEDPDWGKIRIGNTRLDIWGGFQQPARILARILKGASARVGLAEEGEGVDFVDLFSRFAAFKVSPTITIPRELLSGKTAVGEKTSVVGTGVRHSIMLFLQDAYDAAQEEGPLMGGGVLTATGLGVGAATYRDSDTAARRKVKNLRARGHYTVAAEYLAERERTRPEGERRIVTVK